MFSPAVTVPANSANLFMASVLEPIALDRSYVLSYALSIALLYKYQIATPEPITATNAAIGAGIDISEGAIPERRAIGPSSFWAASPTLPSTCVAIPATIVAVPKALKAFVALFCLFCLLLSLRSTLSSLFFCF